jgi:hypothetical protein
LREDSNLINPNRRNLLEAITEYPVKKEMTPLVIELFTKFKEKVEKNKFLKKLSCSRQPVRESSQHNRWHKKQ